MHILSNMACILCHEIIRYLCKFQKVSLLSPVIYEQGHGHYEPLLNYSNTKYRNQ